MQSDEAEHVQSYKIIFKIISHIRSLSGLYTVVRLSGGKRGTCLAAPPPFATVLCKVAYLAFTWGPIATAMDE